MQGSKKCNLLPGKQNLRDNAMLNFALINRHETDMIVDHSDFDSDILNLINIKEFMTFNLVIIEMI